MEPTWTTRNIMKRNLSVITLSLIFIITCWAEQNHFSSGNAVAEWMLEYYRNPQPNLVSSALEILEEDGVLSTNPRAQAPFAGFLSILFQDNPQQTEAWLNQCDKYAEELKRTIWMGLWLSDKEIGKKHLLGMRKGANGTDLEYLKILTENAPFNLKEMTPNDPGQLDMLWGAFTASGNPQYVTRIISVLPLLDKRDNPMKFTMAASAKWSVKSNALIHPLVLQACKKELANASGSLASHLKEIIAEVEGDSTEEDEMRKAITTLIEDFPKEVIDKYKTK